MGKSLHNNSKDRKKRAIHGTVVGENVAFSRNLHSTIKEGIDDIVGQAQRYKNNPLPSRAGYVAEADHCATFNVRKALERDSVRAVREPNGTHGDYKIVKGDKVIRKGEVKYYRTAEQTENAMRGYGDRQLVGPADQIEDVRKIARQKAAKNRAVGKPSRQRVALEHEAVAENASDCITDGKTNSTPRKYKEMQKITKKATRGEITAKDVMPSAGEAVKTAAKSGAVIGAKGGAVIGGVISAWKNLQACRKGEKEVREALRDTVVETAKSAADGAVKGAAGSAATVGATYLAEKVGREVAKKMLNSSAPAVVAIGAVEVGKAVCKYVKGDIDASEVKEKVKETTFNTAGGWAGAEAGAYIGATIGSLIPGMGTVVGATVGGIAGGILGTIGASKLLKFF